MDELDELFANYDDYIEYKRRDKIIIKIGVRFRFPDYFLFFNIYSYDIPKYMKKKLKKFTKICDCVSGDVCYEEDIWNFLNKHNISYYKRYDYYDTTEYDNAKYRLIYFY